MDIPDPKESLKLYEEARSSLYALLLKELPDTEILISPSMQYFPLDFLVPFEQIGIDVFISGLTDPSELKKRKNYHGDNWYRYIIYDSHELIESPGKCAAILRTELTKTSKAFLRWINEEAKKEGDWLPARLVSLGPRGNGYVYSKELGKGWQLDNSFYHSMHLEEDENLEILLDDAGLEESKIVTIRRGKS